MRLTYGLLLHLFWLGLALAAPFVTKARWWLQGRRGLLGHMRNALAKQPLAVKQSPLLWFHCASLGEFEQGRPVLEAHRRAFPGHRILLTFFSPSGYRIRKDYPGADHVFYLPLDTRSNVCRFLDIWKPDLAVFVKYEYWFNYMHEMHRRRIPFLCISAVFRPGQHFFAFYGAWFRKHLRMVSHFFVQDEESSALLQQLGITQVSVSGDTRFDRVAQVAAAGTDLPVAQAFARGRRVLVAGSTWPEDEKLLADLVNDESLDLGFIIAPHEPSKSAIRRLQAILRPPLRRYSQWTDQGGGQVRVLLIDSVGMLSGLYRYGQMAWIGGGFGRGIHNILEPAAFGLPVFFGPRNQAFREARELIRLGGAFQVEHSAELKKRLLHFLAHPALLEEAGRVCIRYVKERAGATDRITSFMASLWASPPTPVPK